MNRLQPLWIAISTYSIFPVPRTDWGGDSNRYALCFLPVVGLLIGGCLLLLHWLARIAAIEPIMFAALATALPLLLSGGIHLDGFMDTADALASHQQVAAKLAIMKDSHSGAFAVIFCGLYLLLCFALYHALYSGWALAAMLPGFILSRSLVALTAFLLPKARAQGMLHAFTRLPARRAAIIALAVLAVLAATAMLHLAGKAGILAIALALLTLLCYCRMCKRQFGGVTGDTSGFFVQTCELALLFGLWLGALIGGLL
jgi:adenosylcobinamide-GDP ribazoletransferase